jgi:hypothetical protein
MAQRADLGIGDEQRDRRSSIAAATFQMGYS